MEAGVDAGGLSFKRRGDVRMYYRVRLPAFLPAFFSFHWMGTCVVGLAGAAPCCVHWGAQMRCAATHHTRQAHTSHRHPSHNPFQAPNEAALCWRGQHEEWAERWGLKVITSTRDTFSDMFDDDETLMCATSPPCCLCHEGRGGLVGPDSPPLTTFPRTHRPPNTRSCLQV